MDIIKISLLGICGVILCFFLKETRPEYTAFITMGIGIMILGLAVGKLEYLFGTLQKLKDSLPVEQEYLTTLVKMIGITYIGQFSAGICKDAGHQATAAQIELFCRLSVLVQSVPILLALLETLVFKVETVFHQSFFQELRNVVQGYMHQHRSDDGCHHI